MTEAVFAARTNKSQKAVQALVKHYNDKVSTSPRAKGVLRKLMTLERNQSSDDDERLHHFLVVELGAHKGTLRYTGPPSVTWMSSGGEPELKDHPLTRDALPKLALLYGQAQSIKPDPEALEAAAKLAEAEPSRDPWRDEMERRLMTHDFETGRRLDNASSSEEGPMAYEQTCKHCGRTIHHIIGNGVPVCIAASAHR